MTVAEIGVKLDRQEIELLIARVWDTATPQQIQTMTAIALAESGGMSNVYGDNVKSGHQAEGSIYQWDDGLLQVNSVHRYDRDKLKSNPAYNVAAAVAIFEKQGFDAWATYKQGLHTPHMKELSDVSLAGRLKLWLKGGGDDSEPNLEQESDVRVVPLAVDGSKHRFLVEVTRGD